jgi:hypothetical protein
MTKSQFPINDERRIMTNRAVRHSAFVGNWGLIGHWDLAIGHSVSDKGGWQ